MYWEKETFTVPIPSPILRETDLPRPSPGIVYSEGEKNYNQVRREVEANAGEKITMTDGTMEVDQDTILEMERAKVLIGSRESCSFQGSFLQGSYESVTGIDGCGCAKVSRTSAAIL